MTLKTLGVGFATERIWLFSRAGRGPGGGGCFGVAAHGRRAVRPESPAIAAFLVHPNVVNGGLCLSEDVGCSRAPDSCGWA